MTAATDARTVEKLALVVALAMAARQVVELESRKPTKAQRAQDRR